MLRFAANISTLFTALPMLERFAAAAQAGFAAVEMQFPYAHPAAELAAAAQAAGVKIVLINMPAGDFAAGERGIACIPGREADFCSAIDLAINYATTLHCPRVNCLAGNLPEGANSDECREVLIKNLRTAADALAAHGLTLSIEPLNRADNPHFFLNGTQHALEFITALARENAALQFDIYHSAMAAEDYCAELTRNITRIGHIQISDQPGRSTPGSGTLDFARFFKTLSQLPYNGWVACEYFDAEPNFTWLQGYNCPPCG